MVTLRRLVLLFSGAFAILTVAGAELLIRQSAGTSRDVETVSAALPSPAAATSGPLKQALAHLRAVHGSTVTTTTWAAVVLLGVAAVAGWALIRLVLSQLRAICSDPASATRTLREFDVVRATIQGTRDDTAAQAAVLNASHAAREERLKQDFVWQRQSADELRTRAQRMITETVGVVVADLQAVIERVEVVREAAGIIDDRVRAADAVTQQVVARAKEADDVVTALGQSLQRVEGMTSVIAQVAAQTNLLALNATIEAARAGVAGKGFAVVATEVKGLARTTAESTVEIAGTVSMLERDASAVGQALAGMSEGISDVNAATEELSLVAQRQHQTVEELARRISETKARLADIATASTKIERRASDRIPVSLDATLIHNQQRFRVVVDTLSDTGLSCETDAELGVDLKSLVSIEIKLGSRQLLLTSTLVRFVENDLRHLAVAFGTDDEASLAAVKIFLDERQESLAAAGV